MSTEGSYARHRESACRDVGRHCPHDLRHFDPRTTDLPDQVRDHPTVATTRIGVPTFLTPLPVPSTEGVGLQPVARTRARRRSAIVERTPSPGTVFDEISLHNQQAWRLSWIPICSNGYT